MGLDDIMFTFNNISFTRIQLYKFAGIHGIHPKLLLSDQIVMNIVERDDGALLTIHSSAIAKLVVFISPQEKVIVNNMIILYSRRNHKGFDRVNRQTHYARKNGYSLIYADAARDDDFKAEHPITKHIFDCPLVGYLVFMKLGYTMSDNNKSNFKDFLITHSKIDQTILDLIKSDYDFWKKEGCTWSGEFNLKDGSDSFTILKEYKRQANN